MLAHLKNHPVSLGIPSGGLDDSMIDITIMMSSAPSIDGIDSPNVDQIDSPNVDHIDSPRSPD